MVWTVVVGAAWADELEGVDEETTKGTSRLDTHSRNTCSLQ